MRRLNRLQFQATILLSFMSCLLLAGVLLSGCVIIPTPPHDGQGVITEETVASFEPGKTTRAAIMLRLGEPEADRFFVYQWEEVHGYIVIGFYVLSKFAPTPATHSLVLEFTPDNRLKRLKMFHPWLPFTDRRASIREWMVEKTESSPP